MAGGAKFPPIVVTEDAWIVDGNTRIGAADLRKDHYFPAIVLDIEWVESGEQHQHELIALAATLNELGGRRLSSKEVREVTEHLLALNWTNENIARAIGVRRSTVSAVRKEIDAANKLARVNLGSNGNLKGASLRALGAKDVLALNDEPFKLLAQLAADSGLNASEIVSFAKQAKDTGSDEGAITHFTSMRSEMEERIRVKNLTGATKPSPARQLRQHLGFVTKYDGREQELFERNPLVSDQHIEALTKAVGVMSRALELQKKG